MELQEIEALAALARLHFEPDQLRAFAQEFQKTLEFDNQLSLIDTQGVPTQEDGVTAAFKRDDETGETLDRNKVLQNAPMSDGTGFLIPRVL